MEPHRQKLIELIHYPGATWNSIASAMKEELLPEMHPDNPLTCNLNTLKTPSKKVSTTLQKEKLSTLLHHYAASKISIITIFDPDYPFWLRNIYQPPWALFAQGDLSLLQKEPKLAVVGSRQASPYGKNAIRLMFPALIEKGIVIVSGLAKGIDAVAHECAMKNGGRTIAVIAGGLYHVYPEENHHLYREMAKSQLVLSEFPPDTKPARWHFPMRNRIISGLCVGTFVVEAKQKSGSLITANYAMNEGREVFALPGSVFNPFSTGTNEFIQHGAKMVTKAEDILEEIPF
ncbi:DNA-processing protein DprA [Bacillus sp. B-jedd]|uniref:DNA-processing protein DprA n=1 Tax=Bacillus sp. B-jedd TaxID=1476857 RepID=UPI00051561C1|nr:DNA-processing protein DprA [Bacillus sp. B-jedd]CEG26814.1 DNA processing Smf single strand binding protein [Bacillus sp. B-jedd]